MKFVHTITADYKPSFRTQSIASMFDVAVEKKLTRSWNVDIGVEEIPDWSIGMIVGPSGSGKSTIARAAFPDAKLFDGSTHEGWTGASIPDDFPKEVWKDGILQKLSATDITGALSQVGFSSPPNWLLPFSALSNGQKFRAEMARLILSLEPDKIALVDEFTSVVDREVAKICSAAVQKMVRKEKKQMIAISCHYDIAEWLEPDWIYHVDTGEFKITRGILRRPRVNLHIEKVHKDAWDFFKGHHYLSADIHAAAQCFVGFINGQPIGFAAAMFFPHPHVKNMWKGHRTVVLPDYQGIGLGNAMSEAVGDYYIDQGFRYTSLTSHPAMIGHRVRSKKWIMTRAPSSTPPVGAKGKLKGCANSSDRMTASFEYIGDRLK